MRKFSHSRLNTFENCGLQFKYQYLDQIETSVETVEAFMGKRVHETLEELYEMKMQGQIPLLNALLTKYEQEWEAHVHDNIRIVKNDKTLNDYREMGRDMITTYYNRYKPFNTAETVSVEERVVLPLKNGKYIIRGYIDRLARNGATYEIHDYKTGSHIPSRNALEKDRQLTLYALAVLETYEDAENVELTWHYLKHDKEITVTPSRDTMETVKQKTVDAIEDVQDAKEQNHFPANVSKLCHWCEFKEICPEWEHVYQENKLPQNTFMTESGGTLVDQYIALQAEDVADEHELAQVEEALVVYAVKNGEKQVHGSRGTVTISFDQVPAIPDSEAEREQLQTVLEDEALWQHMDALTIDELDTAIDTEISEEDQEDVAERVATHLTTEKQPRISVETK